MLCLVSFSRVSLIYWLYAWFLTTMLTQNEILWAKDRDGELNQLLVDQYQIYINFSLKKFVAVGEQNRTPSVNRNMQLLILLRFCHKGQILTVSCFNFSEANTSIECKWIVVVWAKCLIFDYFSASKLFCVLLWYTFFPPFH